MTASPSRSVWNGAAVAVTTVGLLSAFAVWGWQGLVTGVVSSTVLAVFAALLVGIGDGRRAALRRTRSAFAAGLMLTATVALITVFAVAGLCVVLLLMATSPYLHALARRGWKPLKPPAERVTPGVPADDILVAQPADLRRLDDRALCLAWRHSYPLLSAARSPQEQLAVVQRRQEYLDELERRSPQGLAAWFASGGRASSNPLPYLAAHQRHDPPEYQAS